jgi:hypothetical protein
MSTARLAIGIFLILIGVSALFDLPLFRFLFPLLIIYIGIRILSGQRLETDDKAPRSTEDIINEVVIFSEMDKIIKSENFKGGKIVALFAGGRINLAQAVAAQDDIPLEVIVIFGGLKVIIPKGWKVKSEGVAIFGGYENKTSGGMSETIAHIKGSAIFGGVQIVSD